MTPRFFCLSLVLSLTLFCLFLWTPAHAFTQTSNHWLVLNGTTFNEVTQEAVDISATLHVVLQVTFTGVPPNPTSPTALRLRANLLDASAIGQTSGTPYNATGAFQFNAVAFSENFVNTALFRL